MCQVLSKWPFIINCYYECYCFVIAVNSNTFLTEHIYYSGEFCEVNYFWCWSSFTETNHMKPTLKQCLLILQHWWYLFQAQNSKIIQFFYFHLISEADFAFILVPFLIDTQLRHWGKIWTFCYSYWCPPPINMKNVTCITWSEATTKKVPLYQPLSNSRNSVFHCRKLLFPGHNTFRQFP